MSFRLHFFCFVSNLHTRFWEQCCVAKQCSIMAGFFTGELHLSIHDNISELFQSAVNRLHFLTPLLQSPLVNTCTAKTLTMFFSLSSANAWLENYSYELSTKSSISHGSCPLTGPNSVCSTFIPCGFTWEVHMPLHPLVLNHSEEKHYSVQQCSSCKSYGQHIHIHNTRQLYHTWYIADIIQWWKGLHYFQYFVILYSKSKPSMLPLLWVRSYYSQFWD